MRIVFTGGGTLGHLFPIVAIARQLKKLYEKERIFSVENSEDKPSKIFEGNLQIFYIGPTNHKTLEILRKENFIVKRIVAGKIRRYFSIKNLLAPFKVLVGTFQAFFHLFILNPDLVISKGGYGSFPVVVSAWFLQIPVFLHESDSVAGLANKIESRMASWIFTSFPQTKGLPQNKVIAVGNPIREEIIGQCNKQEAREHFQLQGNKPLLLVWGGSQGARFINEVVLDIIESLLESFEVIHQTGPDNFRNVKAEALGLLGESKLKNFYHPTPFLNELELKIGLNCCDFVVSRAGAGSIFEIAALGKPSILIPLPSSAQNHQVENAYAFAKNGACSVMEQRGLSANLLLTKLKHLAERPDLCQKMAEAAKRFSRPKAAQIIAAYILESIKVLSGD